MIKQIADAFGVDPEGLEMVTKESEVENIKEIAEKVARKHGTGGWQTLNDMVRFAQSFYAEVQRQNEPVYQIRPEGENWIDCTKVFYDEWRDPESKRIIFTFPPSLEVNPLTDSFVQTVPDKCDRIVWRGNYHHLPINIKDEHEKVAEACAFMVEEKYDFLGNEFLVSEAIRSGEWRRFVK